MPIQRDTATSPSSGAALLGMEPLRAELDVHWLLRISQELNATLDPDVLLDSLVVRALQLVGAEAGCAGLRTPQGMACHKYFRGNVALPLEYCWPPGHGLPGWLIEHKVPYLTNDALADKQIVHELCEEFGVWSALSTPILGTGGDVVGFFELHNKRDATGFTQGDRDKLVAVSHTASIAIQNATAYQRIRQAEEALRESEEQFRAVFEQTSSGIAQTDLTGRFRLVNDRFCEIVARSREELMGLRMQDITHPEDLPSNREQFTALAEGRGPDFAVEKRYVRPDGSRVWVQNLVSGIHDALGRVRFVAAAVTDITERKRFELLQSEQNSLLELIASGHALEDVLNELTASVTRLDPNARAAVLLADETCSEFEQIYASQIPPSFAEGVHGIAIGELAFDTCGIAVSSGIPVTCRDIARDEHCAKPWRDLCVSHGILAAHSTPVSLPNGQMVASFFICFAEVHEPSVWERRIADFGAHIAGIVIERDRSARALRASEEQLEAELADTSLLQNVSARLIQEDNVEAIYGHVLDTAVEIMHADFGSMQMFCPDFRPGGGLKLIAHRGFSPEAVRLWDWVRGTSMSSCAMATRTLGRVVVPDVEKCEFMAGSRDLTGYRDAGIQAMQSTPLISRRGKLMGMISTHWRTPHRPSGRDLRFLDVLVRQAADLLERSRDEAEREKARQIAELLNRIGLALNSELDPQKLTQTITDLATQVTGAQFGAFFYNVTDEQGESYSLYTLSGAPMEAFAKFPKPRNTAVFGPVFRGEAVVRSDDITRDPRYGKNPPYYGMPKEHLPVRSYLGAPVVSRSGEVLGGLFFGHEKTGIFGDQQERIAVGIAAQAAIALDNARLFAESKRNQEELRRANAELRRANADLEQFAYSASHDLQEPIRNIAIYSEVLKRRYGQALDAAGMECLSFVTTGARRMEMLVNDLLAYAQSANVGDEAATAVDAAIALERALVSLSAAIGESHAEVTYDHLPSVRVHEIQLEHLFQNLVANAIKYRRDDERPRIQVTAEREGDYWLFSVRDNGIGIPVEYKDHVFGIFKRLHRDEKYSGTGIGLAICQKVVERSGGRIWIESEGVGKGSTFYFTLPDGTAE